MKPLDIEHSKNLKGTMNILPNVYLQLVNITVISEKWLS